MRCRAYRRVLQSASSHLTKVQDPEYFTSRCDPDSHVNYRYLDTPEKFERLRNMHRLVRKQGRQLTQLQKSLNKHIKADGVALDDDTHNDFLTIMNKNTSTVLTVKEQFRSIFWQQQLKASSCKSKKGVRWHPAIIRWCLYLHHRSSGAYETLRNSDVLTLPSSRTLRDYRHFAPSSTGFSCETDIQLLKLFQQQQQLQEKLEKPRDLAKYVTVILDEMYIKEGLVFNKHSGEMIGFSDLGEINELLAKYERAYKPGEGEICHRPIAKCVVTFMIRGLFTSMKFVYSQFAAVSTKGAELFVLLWKVIERLTLLGFEVVAVTCDGASNNQKLFDLHGLTNGLPYKTFNVYDVNNKAVFFFRDPPHLIKTIRNCFARGKLWVSVYNELSGVPIIIIKL